MGIDRHNLQDRGNGFPTQNAAGGEIAFSFSSPPIIWTLFIDVFGTFCLIRRLLTPALIIHRLCKERNISTTRNTKSVSASHKASQANFSPAAQQPRQVIVHISKIIEVKIRMSRCFCSGIVSRRLYQPDLLQRGIDVMLWLEKVAKALRSKSRHRLLFKHFLGSPEAARFCRSVS